MRKLFGTDGVRGIANRDLTPELALSLSRAAAFVLSEGAPVNRAILVGRDTRISGPMLEAAVVAGLTSAGVDAHLIGVIPTPGVALATRALRDTGVAGGVMISASHNPIEDNGLKFFGNDGFKLDDQREREIEHLTAGGFVPRPTHLDIGRVRDVPGEVERYERALLDAGADLSGLEIVLDPAHGAASGIAHHVLAALGASVQAINAEADGSRINVRCGATHLEPLREAVRSRGGAAVGVAFDGDADRVLFVDEAGGVITGDHVLYMLALEKQKRQSVDAVVGTSMSNIGLENALAAAGIELVRAAVGDRYVIDAMRSRGLTLGAEASGHVVDFERGTTGDGPMTAVAVLSLVAKGPSLRDLAGAVQIAPQLIRNVPCDRGAAILERASVRAAILQAEAALGDTGRIVVRPSGTEPLVRVMVEAPDRAFVEEVASLVCTAVEEAIQTVNMPA